ncbi:MAG TPA: hypothetical protein VGD98_12335 [Ktedonobacteraceae bacterium]
MRGLIRLYYSHFRLAVAEINGTAGMLLWDGEALVGVTTFEIRENQIYEIHHILNPDKLVYIQQLQIKG